MANRIIPDKDEVFRWFFEGRPYTWMCEEYERKYNRDTTMTMWGNFRRRNGLPKMFIHQPTLIPWQVEERHRWCYAAVMLRLEFRLRAEDPRFPLTPLDLLRLTVWKDLLAADGLVVHYDPADVLGFSYVDRRPDIDLDLIREPGTSA